jgi:hypothetical protein
MRSIEPRFRYFGTGTHALSRLKLRVIDTERHATSIRMPRCENSRSRRSRTTRLRHQRGLPKLPQACLRLSREVLTCALRADRRHHCSRRAVAEPCTFPTIVIAHIYEKVTCDGQARAL